MRIDVWSNPITMPEKEGIKVLHWYIDTFDIIIEHHICGKQLNVSDTNAHAFDVDPNIGTVDICLASYHIHESAIMYNKQKVWSCMHKKKWK